MMSYRGLVAYIATLMVVVQALVGCTTEVDYTLGSEFVPTDQKMEMHRRVYKGGKVYIDNAEFDLPMTTTRLYQTDSIKSSKLDYVYFGREHSDTYGTRRAGFMSQVLFGSKLDEEYGWGYRPIFDSMQMALYVTDFHGDTINPLRFNVYEIISNDYIVDSDSIFYINFDPTNYISKEPIFTFDYPDYKRGVYVGDMENPTSQYVTLQPTSSTNEYVSRLMFTTQEDLDKNEGYGKDNDEIYEQGNEEEFVKRIRGVYVAPADDNAEDGEGAMFAADVENSALVLYARSRYKEDPTIIKDTTIMSYNFFINPTEYDVKAGNVSLSTVRHTLPESINDLIETGSDIEVGYVDGMGGVVTELRFTDEFIQSLADIALSKPDAVVSVNQARMSIYLEGSSYDYNAIDPIMMAGIMDKAMPRMGLYTRYGGIDANKNNLIAISDYAYSSEGSVTLDYDGNINRSLGCYTMDISTHIQSLMMAAADNVDESGKVDFSKFDANDGDTTLVSYRRVYIAPAADLLFGFNRQALFGGNTTDVITATSDAPITLDLTYTIVY